MLDPSWNPGLLFPGPRPVLLPSGSPAILPGHACGHLPGNLGKGSLLYELSLSLQVTGNPSGSSSLGRALLCICSLQPTEPLSKSHSKPEVETPSRKALRDDQVTSYREGWRSGLAVVTQQSQGGGKTRSPSPLLTSPGGTSQPLF